MNHYADPTRMMPHNHAWISNLRAVTLINIPTHVYLISRAVKRNHEYLWQLECSQINNLLRFLFEIPWTKI
jgi:hypothetical protein